MKTPGLPVNEVERLHALREYEILDSASEPSFDALTTLAAYIAQAPIALVSLIDVDRQWFKSHYGLDASETPRDVSFCGHVVASEAPLIVPDAHEDERFADNPLVMGGPRVRFYTGMPLRNPTGYVLGTLCVIDQEPRHLSDTQREMLALLAQQVVELLELRRKNRELEAHHEFFVASPNMICTANTQMQFLSLNPAWERNLGWAQAELRARPAMSFVHLDDRVHTSAKLGQTFELEGRQVQFDNRMQHKAGHWIPLSWTTTSRDGTLFATATDMSVHQAREEQLALAHARLRAVFENMVDALISIDVKGTIRQMNPAVERLFGYSPDELMGENVRILMPSPFREQHDGYLSNYLETGVAKIIGIGRQVVARRKDGTTFDAELSVAEVRVGDERSFSGIIRDISERRRAFEASRHLAAVVRHSDDAIITKNRDGVISSWNDAAARMFDYSESEVMGQSITLLFPNDRLDEERLLLARIAAGERVAHYETLRLRKGGIPVDVSVTISPLYAEDGEVVGASKIIRDISERKKLERMKTEFVATVSHELRTPLTSIRGALGLVAGGVTGELPEEAKEYIDIALSNSDRLVRLINDILDMEKMESGRMEFKLQALELSGVIKDALASNASFAAAEGTRFVLVSDIPPGEVLVDPDRLSQVMANLLSNAAKYAPQDTAVEIAVVRRGGVLRVTVRDHGPGVPEEFRDKLFSRFAQADGSTTRKIGGSGLGLNISKGIIEHLRGRIGYEPAESGGSLFYFELPYLQPVTAEHSTAQKRILVCEDDPEASRLVDELFTSEGFCVDLAPTVERARRLLAVHRYDVITLDLLLADGHGADLIREIRVNPETQTTPIIVTAGSPNPFDQASFSVADVLEKPLDERRLLLAVQNAIAGCSTTRPRLLHVEDDADIRRIVARTLPQSWTVVAANSIQEARAALEEAEFDVVLLDITLPDGHGGELLGFVGRAHVIIFSASEASAELSRRVSAALVKTRSNPFDVAAAIRAILEPVRAVE